MTARAVRILLVGAGPHELADRLARVAPRARLLKAADAAAGEALLGQVDAVIAGQPVTPAYARATHLRWLHLTAAGIEAQAIPELRDAPFPITHKALASVNPMADHVMAQILVFSRRVLELHTLQRERRWSEHGGPAEQAGDLRGKTLGVVGLGAVGRAIARRARPFGMRVVGTRRDAGRRPPNVARVYPPERLRDVLAEADYLALTVPLTAETDGLIGEAELRAMKPTAYLVNVSRGRIVREAVLVRALRERWIAGASLDVFEREPLPPESPLWELAVVTPHCSGGGPVQRREAADEIARNLRRFVRGQGLLYQINRADVPRA
jgi:phosphoglycerate dehydrogenase-like enzyme